LKPISKLENFCVGFGGIQERSLNKTC